MCLYTTRDFYLLYPICFSNASFSKDRKTFYFENVQLKITEFKRFAPHRAAIWQLRPYVTSFQPEEVRKTDGKKELPLPYGPSSWAWNQIDTRETIKRKSNVIGIGRGHEIPKTRRQQESYYMS